MLSELRETGEPPHGHHNQGRAGQPEAVPPRAQDFLPADGAQEAADPKRPGQRAGSR